MLALIQRVSSASVEINKQIVGQINNGILILLGVGENDDENDIEKICYKLHGLRIFNDENGKLNLNHEQVDADLLVVSQFTLLADYKKGNRPSFIHAAKPEKAKYLYQEFVNYLGNLTSKTIKTGEFGADMKVHLVNDGPVTIMIDSEKL